MEVEQLMISVLQDVVNAIDGKNRGVGHDTVLLGRLDEIELKFRRTAELKPRSCYVLCCYGMLLEVMGRCSEALPVYRKAVEAQSAFKSQDCNHNRRLIVLLHNNNDLDHIAPVIYKWTKAVGSPVFVFWVPDFPEHKNVDFLINFIKKLPGVHIHTPDPALIAALDWSYKFRKAGVLKTGTTVYGDGYGLASALLEHYLPLNEDGIFVADPYLLPMTIEVCNAAHLRNVKCISLPHSETVVFNKKVLKNDCSIVSQSLDHNENAKLFEIFDKVVYPSRFVANFTAYVPEHKKVVLGSARNSTEWLKVLSSILPKIHFDNSDNKLKIVIFIPSTGYCIYVEEIVRTIRMLTRFPGIFLVVKLHPRETDFESRMPHAEEIEERDPTSWVTYVGNDVFTPQLVEWGEIFLSIATGAVYHPLKLSKPVLELSYAMGFMTVLAKYLPCADIRYRDRLIELIWQFKDLPANERSSHYYNRVELENFLHTFIESNTQPALDAYVNFLRGV